MDANTRNNLIVDALIGILILTFCVNLLGLALVTLV